MDFIEIAKKRYSVRSYKDKKVEEEKLQKILEAAHVAPTAANLQPVRLIVVQSSEGLAKIGKGANLYGGRRIFRLCRRGKLVPCPEDLGGRFLAERGVQVAGECEEMCG